jgi:hypothetical protein
MLRIAAFASRVVASIPTVFPCNRFASTNRCWTHVKTVRCVSTSINRRVREIVEWSGDAASSPRPRKLRTASESAARQAMPRSESMPSRYPISKRRKYRPGVRLGRPITGA